MRPLFYIFLGFCVSSCTICEKGKFSGTWAKLDIAPSHYYLRIYPDGKVAQWPSPPDGDVSWSHLNGNELLWNYGYGGNPRIYQKGNKLIMKTSTSSQTLYRFPSNLEPGQKAQQGAAANP